ncbi:Glutathione S-transferase 3 [Pseudocercospora fuligena]|uniref:Glutathione S-transferase 3 n=1 Tax=Pseudocercospora fuligena TaxID=685502 RepID=A0A8H6RDB5_9PEZI|nr:Glutathione S-transferase 3 [Pseudocercospora fuligena]
MVLTVHHLGHSQSDRVVFLCEELGINYQLKKYDRSPVLSPPEFKSLHPIGAAPVIEDDGGVKMAETAACFEYIINIHGQGKLLVKPGEKNYSEFLYWYHFTNGTLQPGFGRTMAMTMAGILSDNATMARYHQRNQTVLKLVDDRLGEVPYLAGEEFTAADAMIIFSLTTMREFCPVDLSDYKNILSYIQKIVTRPAYKRYLEKGDPDIDIQQFTKGPPPPVFAAFKQHK